MNLGGTQFLADISPFPGLLVNIYSLEGCGEVLSISVGKLW